MALGLTGEGARGTTAQEIHTLLHTRDIDNLPTAYQQLMEKILSREDREKDNSLMLGDFSKPTRNEIHIANGLWINNNMNLLTGYKKLAEDQFSSDVISFDGNDIATADAQLQDWVRRKTNNTIKKVAPLKQENLITIVNAIYFRGLWAVPFDEKKTKKKTFHTLHNEKTQVDFLRGTRQYFYYEDDDVQVVQIPYTSYQFSLMVILPRKKGALPEVEQKLSVKMYSHIKEASTQHEVILSLPKLQIETDAKFEEAIKRMGYQNMFSMAANFFGMTNSAPLSIGTIAQKTKIKLGEKNTEASAVSTVDMITGYSGKKPVDAPPPKIFNANHPFLFCIVDNRTNALSLLAGL